MRGIENQKKVRSSDQAELVHRNLASHVGWFCDNEVSGREDSLERSRDFDKSGGLRALPPQRKSGGNKQTVKGTIETECGILAGSLA
jgi:hypothetical protein